MFQIRRPSSAVRLETLANLDLPLQSRAELGTLLSHPQPHSLSRSNQGITRTHLPLCSSSSSSKKDWLHPPSWIETKLSV